MQNIEFKAELRDRVLAEYLLAKTGAVRVAGLEQTDTYFRIADGRLKRRQSASEPTEWIYYNRDVSSTPKLSQFAIYSEKEALERFGSRPLPVWLIVNKQREIWINGPVRVHLDRVVGLGEFIEIEALVTPKRPIVDCQRAVEALRREMAMTMGEPISCGYADLAARNAA